MERPATDTTPRLAAARGLLMLQLVDHWGNRHTPRPQPRADVLAAAFLLGAHAGDASPTAELAWGCSRYAAYLVRRLAGRVDGTANPEEQWEPLLAALREEPRYRNLLAAGADEVNRAVLTVARTLADHLLAGGGAAAVPALPQREGPAVLRLARIGPSAYRLRPWPLAGRRLVLHADLAAPGEGNLPESRARCSTNLVPWRHLRWTLLAPATPAD